MTELLIGHLLGDFLFQPKKMAIEKGNDSSVCVLHCYIYTTFVLVMAIPLIRVLPGWYGFVLPFAIGVPHFIIDRFSLADRWAKLLGGRTFDEAGREFIATRHDDTGVAHTMAAYDVAFTSIVYTVTDFTMHLICLWAVYEWMLV